MVLKILWRGKSMLKTSRSHSPNCWGVYPRTERTVVEMKFYEGLRAVEIAGRLGLSEGRISQLSRTALAKLE